MVCKKKFLFCIAAFLSLGVAADDSNNPLSGLDDYIITGMSEWEIPGLAIAIVKDDSIKYAKGFGVNKLGEPGEVNENTLFGIASLTKAFTAAGLGILVDDGKIHWDDPVIKYLPDFQLYDPWVTREITVRDLLIHRSGLGRMIGNRLQFMTGRDSDELTYRLRYLEPIASFRAQYIYNNMMYMVAGKVIESVTGQPWYDLIEERIFGPLGMERSNFSIHDLEDEENAAWPHQYIEGNVEIIPRRDFDNIGPAGSINASAIELTQWMRLHLGNPGKLDAERLITSETMTEMHRPQSAVPVDHPEKEFAAYGLGWGIRLYRDRIIMRHAGASDGMNAFIVLMHENNLGVVILTNIFNDFMYALANYVLDSYLGIPEPEDWNEKYLAEYREIYEKVRENREQIHRDRIVNTNPSLPAGSFAGKYYDKLYGDVTVSVRDGGIFITFWGDETLIADLEHWHHDTFRAVWRNPAQREKFVWFDLDKSGEAAFLNVEFNLRPDLLQVGAYPSGYTRVVRFVREN